jgi:hypothetical protein
MPGTCAAGTCARKQRCSGVRHATTGGYAMRGILLWFLGIPIPIIILLYLFNVL